MKRITARYDGTCKKCGQPINRGDEILWERGAGAEHVECPASELDKYDGEIISISKGEGYGGELFEQGSVISHNGQDLYVMASGRKYIAEDGMSMGVGDECGHIFWAECRPATEDECAPLRAREAFARDRATAKARLAELVEKMKSEGHRPTHLQSLRGEKILDTSDNYGGGDWWDIGYPYIFYVQNNGADGDAWELNNVETAGAGAIGWRIERDEIFVEELRHLHKILMGGKNG